MRLERGQTWVGLDPAVGKLEGVAWSVVGANVWTKVTALGVTEFLRVRSQVRTLVGPPAYCSVRPGGRVMDVLPSPDGEYELVVRYFPAVVER